MYKTKLTSSNVEAKPPTAHGAHFTSDTIAHSSLFYQNRIEEVILGVLDA